MTFVELWTAVGLRDCSDRGLEHSGRSREVLREIRATNHRPNNCCMERHSDSRWSDFQQGEARTNGGDAFRADRWLWELESH
jgi:hypothetical protein